MIRERLQTQDDYCLSIAWERVFFGSQYEDEECEINNEYKGVDLKTVTIASLCCKLFYKIVCGAEAGRSFWRPLVSYAFKSFESKFEIDSVWRDVFCHYSNEIKKIAQEVLKVIDSEDPFIDKTVVYDNLFPFKEHLELSNSCAKAQYCFGAAFEFGLGCKVSYEDAFYYYKLSADQGYAVAQNKVGSFYAIGLTVPQDLNLAFKYYQLAADQGEDETLFHMGYRCEHELADYDQAYKYYRLAADKGIVEAYFSLGSLYENGLGDNSLDSEEEMEEAFKCYKFAADREHAGAQFNVGCFYEQGLGTEQNMEMALKYYLLAANQGCSDAQVNVAICYEQGLGIHQDVDEALKYYRLSAAQGNEEAVAKIDELEDQDKQDIQDKQDQDPRQTRL